LQVSGSYLGVSSMINELLQGIDSEVLGVVFVITLIVSTMAIGALILYLLPRRQATLPEPEEDLEVLPDAEVLFRLKHFSIAFRKFGSRWEGYVLRGGFDAATGITGQNLKAVAMETMLLLEVAAADRPDGNREAANAAFPSV
jgi:hypothetical protein